MALAADIPRPRSPAAGYWQDATAGVGLAHRRLSIIDLDARANQPMQNEDGSLVISFNGEIYNFQEIRQELEKQGRHTWRSHSDTEVLLHLYEEHGPQDTIDYLKKLRGMFAFALWDGRQHRLLLARDPLGKKPLYYAQTAEGLVFASSIKALLQDEQIPREINYEAIELYLILGFVPAPLTAFRGIFKLPAGHYLLADNTGGSQVGQYWEPGFEPKYKLPAEDLQQLIIEKLESAIRLRMVSDVPLGVFLSGGIDSSAIVALMSRLTSRPLKTFTVGFVGMSQDESRLPGWWPITSAAIIPDSRWNCSRKTCPNW